MTGMPCALRGARRSATPSSARRCATSPAAWRRSASSPATAWRSWPEHARSGCSPTSARYAPARSSSPVYHASSPEESEYVLGDSGSCVVIVEDAAQAPEDGAGARRAAGARARRRARRHRRRGDHARRAARPRGATGARSSVSASATSRRGPRHDRVHLRHDRAAEGLRPHPRQPAQRRRRLRRAASTCGARPR